MNRALMILGVAGFLFTSCQKDQVPQDNQSNKVNTTDDPELEVKDFVYNAMNDIYLYKADVAELADDYFTSASAKTDYLNTFDSPEALFDAVTASSDRFSFITDDYNSLEDSFAGVSGSTGMKYGLGRITGTNDVFAYLEYILPGTSAEEAGLTRGTVFTEVNGQQLTMSNYSDLLSADNFTINIGKIENGVIKMTDQTVTLEDIHYTSNPVYIAKTLNVDGTKVGYLMYNSFVGDFDDELNAAFAQFQADGVTDLILDLRYNGGGSVESAIDLASMITGQFDGKVFMKEQWNEKYQQHFESVSPESLVNKFDSKIRTGETINSLNLSKVYIITTAATASASELVINGLAPYINVVQVGETTTGKFQASVTIYDSSDYSREKANENHTYALQPLVFKSVNSAGKTDYGNGLDPNVVFPEDLNDLGTLGDPSEPLLQAAINDILGKTQKSPSEAAKKAAANFRNIGNSEMFEPDYQRMYIDKIPAVLQ
ncbi:MAG: S41 family peptidase [Salegentibacter sp.]